MFVALDDVVTNTLQFNDDIVNDITRKQDNESEQKKMFGPVLVTL